MFDNGLGRCVHNPNLVEQCSELKNGICDKCHSLLLPDLDSDEVRCYTIKTNCSLMHGATFGLILGCLECMPGNYLVYKYIYDIYIDEYKAEPQYCKPCPAECFNCASPTTCIGCNDEHTYIKDGRCHPCGESCDTCYGPGEQCLICADGSRAYKGRCGPNKYQTYQKHITPFKFRFHTFIIIFIILLAIFSFSLRLILAIYDKYENDEYKIRSKIQKILWPKKKADLHIMKKIKAKMSPRIKGDKRSNGVETVGRLDQGPYPLVRPINPMFNLRQAETTSGDTANLYHNRYPPH